MWLLFGRGFAAVISQHKHKVNIEHAEIDITSDFLATHAVIRGETH
ncbi:hypothetical protein [Psychrobacter sp. JCM 18900]|nr:hypothetical protein [Psychrobacter sp. JCM 18900]